MSEVIIDIETLGTRPDSIILTIAAIKFNRYDELETHERYESIYLKIKTTTCERVGLKSYSDTIKWWGEQNEVVRREALEDGKDRISIQDALKQLSNFVRDCEYFWSQGNLDQIVLENAYIVCNMSIPWRYWKYFDSRTLFHVTHIKLIDIKYETNLAHNALIDCYRQLIGMHRAFNK